MTEAAGNTVRPQGASAGAAAKPRRKSRLEKLLVNRSLWRGIVALVGFVVFWEICSQLEGWSKDWSEGWSESWFGGWFGGWFEDPFVIQVPWIGKVPPPTEVLAAWSEVVMFPGYWESWYLSTGRVFAGFIAAMILGIPFGLALAVNRYFHDIFFPPFEVLRPIPPLAWVPASIIFWPTTEMSIAFVTFLGAFFTIVINVLGGARSIDIRYLRAAQSMGANQWHMFSRIVLPGTLPSIFTGAAVGMGITWEVVLAGEMISGGGQQGGGGLGFFIWSSYMGGTVAQVIVGMISIGIAGYLSSTLIRYIGSIAMPWRRLF